MWSSHFASSGSLKLPTFVLSPASFAFSAAMARARRAGRTTTTARLDCSGVVSILPTQNRSGSGRGIRAREGYTVVLQAAGDRNRRRIRRDAVRRANAAAQVDGDAVTAEELCRNAVQ